MLLVTPYFHWSSLYPSHPSYTLLGNFNSSAGQVSRRHAQRQGKAQPSQTLLDLGYLHHLVSSLPCEDQALVLPDRKRKILQEKIQEGRKDKGFAPDASIGWSACASCTLLHFSRATSKTILMHQYTRLDGERFWQRLACQIRVERLKGWSTYKALYTASLPTPPPTWELENAPVRATRINPPKNIFSLQFFKKRKRLQF